MTLWAECTPGPPKSAQRARLAVYTKLWRLPKLMCKQLGCMFWTQSIVSNTRLPLLYLHSCWFCGACSRHHMMHGCKPRNNDWTKRRLGVWTCKLSSIHQPNGGLLWQECITRFLAFHEHPSGYLLEFDFITTLFPSLGFVELWWSFDFDQFNCAFSLFAPGVLLC